tara:strand:+ start:303802 stop:304803 length:1002 start_codon:yes stop_codon:yes gene_type:complete
MWTLSIAVTTGTLLVLITAFFFSKKGTTLSLAIGIAFSVLLGLIIYGLIIYGFRIELFAPSWISQIFAQVAGATSGFTLFRAGSILVPLKHRAVITVLEERRNECPTLGEGAAWLFPGIMDAVAVDARDFEVNVSEFDVLTSDYMTVKTNPTIVLAVECPSGYLNVEGLEEIVRQLTRRATRARANDLDVDKIVMEDEALSVAVLSELQESSDRNGWGIKIKEVRFEGITPPKEITKAAELEKIEEYQRSAEIYEAKTLEKKVSVLMDKFGDVGMTPDKAFNLLQAESGKITRTAFDLEGINTSDVLGAIVAVVEELRKQGSKNDSKNDGDAS